MLAQALRGIVPMLADEAFFQRLVDEATLMAAPAWVGNAEALSRFDYRGRTAAFTGPSRRLGPQGRRHHRGDGPETAAAFSDARLEILEASALGDAEDPSVSLRSSRNSSGQEAGIMSRASIVGRTTPPSAAS